MIISSPANVTCPNDTSCQRNMVHNLSQLPSLAGGFVSDIISVTYVLCHVCDIFTFIDMAPIFDHLHPDLYSFPILLISHKGSHKVKPEYALKTNYNWLQLCALLGVTYAMVRKL